MTLPKVRGDRGGVFKEEFEEVFLRFRKPLAPRIPSYGRKKEAEGGTDEEGEEE